MIYPTLYRMKVTALIPDDIVSDVKLLTGGKNLTESLLIALREWISLKKIIALNNEIEKRPLRFADHYSAESIRQLNRS
ncbi:DUF2191 domain-containing protein [candidate division CSSED10-310 bacterium]|uniref:DUF2191 domain-containing protein n=1 Tax=candidate division CSSED10-310 bacterium TaxID=2855610 RepID=A0ABV6Z6F0_UNCC1